MSELLHEVKAIEKMMHVPAEGRATGFLDEGHGLIAILRHCQLEDIILDIGVVITPYGLPGDRVVDCVYVLLVCNIIVDNSAFVCLPLVV
jgi:hypothetical protein